LTLVETNPAALGPVPDTSLRKSFVGRNPLEHLLSLTDVPVPTQQTERQFS